MFEGWEDFYLLIGSAAAALIGLLFVVSTLQNRVGRSQALRGATLYMTPVVFHFAMIVVLSGTAMAPHLDRYWAGVLTSLWSGVGLVHGAVILVLFQTMKLPGHQHWSDVWCYAVGPTVIYAAMAAASWAIWQAAPCAPPVMAAVLVALLLLCIRNAWDLVTWLSPRPDGEVASED
jgi:hypothetical protein